MTVFCSNKMSIQEDGPLEPSIDLGEPTEDLIEWAKEHINEDPDKRDQVISDFRDLIFFNARVLEENVLHIGPMTNSYCGSLRARHFIVKLAHRLIVNYYNFKESNPQYFKDVRIERLRELTKHEIISVPPYKDQLGRRTLIIRIAEVEVDEIFQVLIVTIELAAMEPSVQIKGGVVIFDLSDLSVSQAWYMTPTIANHIIQIAVKCFPVRLEKIHILHQSWVFDIGYNFVKPLMNDNIKERIAFHGDDLESLHSYIDPKHLPERYGGIHKDYPADIWFECIRKHDNVIEHLIELGYEDAETLKGQLHAENSNL
ncbi:hypothetical protein NQ317_004438 [Molorchus minor]|uniref:CRAL-TRIO domain-containing protein n=1 Tax=Molorchus minor TaxID=1323400 RepID=A0ABQ9JCD8_9CUCU|nr:hypothetical protein NQ317_004438 [Molorchus minor]